MARRVFVHIGTMKSATTYLQELAARNTEQLAAAGVLWPADAAPFFALADLLGRGQQPRLTARAWPSLMQSFEAHDGDAVFSNELLAQAGQRKIKRFIEGLPSSHVHVVLTARDLTRVIPSHWQTTLQNGGTASWSKFCAAVCREPASANAARSDDLGSWFWRRHDVPEVLQRWREFVPVERMTLVTVPPPGTGNRAVAERFATAIGIDAGRLAQPEFYNSSVGASSAELLRRLNLVAPGLDRQHYVWGVRNALFRGALMQRAEQEPRFGLTQEHQTWVCDRAERMIAEIKALGVNVIGDVDDLRPPSQARPNTVNPEAASDGELLEAALAGLAELVRTVGDLQQERAPAGNQVRAGVSQTTAEEQRAQGDMAAEHGLS
jgi:hypothetical protein